MLHLQIVPVLQFLKTFRLVIKVWVQRESTGMILVDIRTEVKYRNIVAFKLQRLWMNNNLNWKSHLT